MRSLVFVHKTEEVSPHSLLVHIRDPGDGLISLDLLESHIVTQPRPGDRRKITTYGWSRYDWMKANRSALIVSAWVVGIPCGKPG